MSSPARLSRAERQQQTRESLMRSAVEVFAERGVQGGSVEEICARAGYTRGAFYSNFESKDELCLALLNQTMALVMTNVSTSLDRSAGEEGGVNAVEAVLAAFMQLMPMDDQELLFMRELELYALREPSFRAAYLEYVQRAHLSFSRLIVDALASRGLELAVPDEFAIRILENEFSWQRILGVLDGDADGGRLRIRKAVTQAVKVLTRPARSAD